MALKKFLSPLEKEVFVCFDCEATGLDPAADRIVEIAVGVFDFQLVMEQAESLIDPECPIPETSIAIHHITEEMVKGKPKIEEKLPEILRLIGTKTLVGHGIEFDIEIIAHAAERAKIPCRIRENPFLDTLRMARLYGECPVNSLEQLRQHFGVKEEGAHRAMSDVLVNIQVFRHLAKRFRSAREIFDVLARPILLKNMPLGKHKGRPMKEVPLEYLLWAANKDFDQDLLFSIRSELKRRKQGNLFTQASNPFQDL